MPWGLEKRARLRARGDDLPCQAGMTETISFGKPEPDQGRPTTELPWSRLILTSTAQVTRPVQVPFGGHFRNSSVFLSTLPSRTEIQRERNGIVTPQIGSAFTLCSDIPKVCQKAHNSRLAHILAVKRTNGE